MLAAALSLLSSAAAAASSRRIESTSRWAAGRPSSACSTTRRAKSSESRHAGARINPAAEGAVAAAGNRPDLRPLQPLEEAHQVRRKNCPSAPPAETALPDLDRAEHHLTLFDAEGERGAEARDI